MIPLCVALCITAATAGSGESRPSWFVPVEAPLRHLGVFHVATGTWTRGSSAAAVVGPDVIFDNTCLSGYYAALETDLTIQTRQVVPSPTRPLDPCTAPFQSAPGCQTSYEVNGFSFAYCSSSITPVDWSIEFADLYLFCSVDMVPTRSFAVTGLPGGTASGAQNCWVVDIDLSAVNPPFVLQADGNGGYDGSDTFGLSWTLTSAAPGSSSGMLLAGDLDTCSQTDGTIWDHPIDLGEEGTGMGAEDFFRLTGATTIPPAGCYFFGDTGPRGMYIELYADTGCASAPPVNSFCHPGQAGVLACPCGNPPGGSERGCNNSAGTGGAQLDGAGVPSLSADTLLLVVEGERPSALSLFVQGPSTSASGFVFGQGVRCVTGILKRLYARSAVDGSVAAGACHGDPSVSSRSAALGDTILPGQLRDYFVYYRDPIVLGGCPAIATFNASQAISVSWLP